MKERILLCFSVLCAVVVFVAGIAAAKPASAALVPTLSLAAVNNNTQIQMTVFGADPNAPVMFYYPAASSVTAVNVGQTSSSGYFVKILDPNVYSIAVGASTYVLVDGSQSQIIAWPSYTASSNTTSSYMSLSQSNISLFAGQVSPISVTSSSGILGNVTVSNNSNSSVATASVNGGQVTVYASAPGSTVMTICASSAGCASLYVTVQQQSAAAVQQTSSSPTIAFSQSSLVLTAGQSQSITLSGQGSYYVSNNSNPSVATTQISGATLAVNAVAAGTDTLSICAASDTSSSCGTVSVTVNQSSSSSASTPTSVLSLSQSSIQLTVGQTIPVTVTLTPSVDSPVYYISGNSNSSSVTANISGAQVSMYGVAFGGSTVTVCQLGGPCANVYAYVMPGSSTASVTSSTALPLALSSFNLSSNDVGGSFMHAGAALSLSFTTNQNVLNPVVSIGGSSIAVSGSGSGPYALIYTMKGTEALPLVADISFSNQAGNSARMKVTLTDAAPVPVSTSAGPFTAYLSSGSSGAQVTALQKRLIADGFFTGSATGTYGPLTEAAVKKYQAKHGLSQAGVVGPSTRQLLNQGI